MPIFKCKMCGGELELNKVSSVTTCEYCGTKQTVPKSRDEVVSNLFSRANSLRLKCEFDKAEQIYEKILDIDNTDSEAHWGVVLCKYGIEYVEDPKTFSRMPTCHRTLYEAVLTDVNYLAAIENADAEQKELYIAEAKAIDELQKNILNIVNREEPFDIFICYKETDENGKRTIDSAIANDIYYQLTQEGFKVFYAPITLEDKLGHEYEPYIFAAINSSKVMLVVGTKPEYFDSVWVRNEWSRFFKTMKNDRSKLLIPCYRDMDVYELPEEFAHLQAQDMGKIGFIYDVVRGLRKVFNRDVVQPTQAVQPIESKPKKESKIKRKIANIKAKLKERAKYCLKLPLHNFCFAFFVAGLIWTIYFLYEELSFEIYGHFLLPLIGCLIQFLIFIRFIKNKAIAIIMQSLILVASILLATSIASGNFIYDCISLELFFLSIITAIMELIWLVLICFSKKTEKAKIKKTNKIKKILFPLASIIVVASMIVGLEVEGLSFGGYHLAKAYYNYGAYEQAYEFFDSLDNYKDSEYMAKESQYRLAKAEAEFGWIDGAIDRLSDIENHEEAKLLRDALLYDKAKSMYEEGSYCAAAKTLAVIDTPEAKALFETVKKDAHNYALERINANGYAVCTVEDLYNNPKKYNGKKVCITAFNVYTNHTSLKKDGSSFASYVDRLSYVSPAYICDDLSLYAEEKNDDLSLLNYYLENIKTSNIPYVYGYGWKDYRAGHDTSIPEETSIVTICGKFTYNPNIENAYAYEKYKLDVEMIFSLSNDSVDYR